jgi:hypothetical protein
MLNLEIMKGGREMKRYSIEELIDINDFFECAANVYFSRFNKYAYLKLVSSKGDIRSYILEIEQLDKILTNYYIETLNRIILYGLDHNHMDFRVIMGKKQNSVEVTVDNVFYICTIEEWNFINRAIRAQRYSI